MDTDAIKQNKRILVVEDDKHLNNLIAYSLEKNGYAVESVYDGYAAQDILSDGVFDLVILDIMLPGIDGFRICESIKKGANPHKPRVVILTARTQPLDRIYGTVVGADSYFIKPFSLAKLIAAIKDMLAAAANP